MSESAGFAIRLPDTVGHANSPAADFDLSVAHSFWFGRRLWMSAVGLCVQAALLLAAGIFLLTQISSTPNLTVQIAITGALLTLGGLAMIVRALGDFLSGLKVDRQGLRVRMAGRGFAVPWTAVERWNMSPKERKLKELPGITVWVVGNKKPFTVPDGYLDPLSRFAIYHLFRALAHEKEDI
jgi:hypothetical protein